MNEVILNSNAKRAIEVAYDTFPKDEFLCRLYDYIRSSLDLAVQQEKLYQAIQKSGIEVTKKP